MIGGRKSRAQVAAVAAAFLGLIQVSLSAGASGVSSQDPGASQTTARSAEGFWDAGRLGRSRKALSLLRGETGG